VLQSCFRQTSLIFDFLVVNNRQNERKVGCNKQREAEEQVPKCDCDNHKISGVSFVSSKFETIQ